MMDVIEHLVRKIEMLEARVNQLDRRNNNMFREGTIKTVDFAKGMAVVDAGGVETDMSPWLERSGAIRDWTPPSEGERVVFISPSGDPGQGLILPGGYSSRYQQNHNKGAEPTRTVGDTEIQQTGSEIRLTAGASSLVLTSGSVTLLTPDYRVNP